MSYMSTYIYLTYIVHIYLPGPYFWGARGPGPPKYCTLHSEKLGSPPSLSTSLLGASSPPPSTKSWIHIVHTYLYVVDVDDDYKYFILPLLLSFFSLFPLSLSFSPYSLSLSPSLSLISIFFPIAYFPRLFLFFPSLLVLSLSLFFLHRLL
jgi:hypothetical protein